MATVDIDMSEVKQFFALMGEAVKGPFREEISNFLDAIGTDFLRVVQDEIVRRKVMDSRLLLASFERGTDDNVWTLEEDGLVLEVGSSVNYAAYVNDGHWTNPKGVDRRFVPGYWQEDRFIYDPDAKGGMMLKQKWVGGAHYFDSALRILERLIPDLWESKAQEWMDRYFGG